VLAVAWLAVMHFSTGSLLSWVLAGLAAASLVAGLVAARSGREGWAFAGTFAAIALATASLFVALFPDVMPSTLDPEWSLTVDNAASSARTLGIMTWVAVVFTPIVLLYQSWTYWTFRKRISGHHIPTDVHHAAVTAETVQAADRPGKPLTPA
jgi:cytochrome d ubiquinol oxidase subunit II